MVSASLSLGQNRRDCIRASWIERVWIIAVIRIESGGIWIERGTMSSKDKRETKASPRARVPLVHLRSVEAEMIAMRDT